MFEIHFEIDGDHADDDDADHEEDGRVQDISGVLASARLRPVAAGVEDRAEQKARQPDAAPDGGVKSAYADLVFYEKDNEAFPREECRK